MSDTQRTSHLLRSLILEHDGKTITLAQILAPLGDRMFGFLMFLLAFPNCLPMPPGFSTITGLPILLVAGQFLAGHPHPILPVALAQREFNREHFANVIHKIMPSLIKAEAVFKPRWLWLSQGWCERFLALLVIFLGFILILPIPLGNLPPALAIAIIGVGLIERDGMVIAIGAATGIISTLLLYQVWILILGKMWDWAAQIITAMAG